MATCVALIACGGGGSSDSGVTGVSGTDAGHASIAGTVAASDISWNVYDASALPDKANAVQLADGTYSQFSFCNTASCKNTYSSVSDGILNIDSQTTPSDETWYRVKNVFSSDSYPKYATVVFRTRAPVVTSGTLGLMVMLNMGDTGALSGPRVQLFVQAENNTNGGLVIFNTDTTPGTVTPNTYSTMLSTSQWHTYQLTAAMTSATAGTVKVYMDGASTPVISKKVTKIAQVTTAGDGSLRIGEGATNAYGDMDLDWIIWTNGGAYTPAELAGHLPVSLGPVAGY